MNEGKKVIIPAAKIVPKELQKLGKLPGIIYPVNQKITFDYLYDEYKDFCTSIDIICYEQADKVHKRLQKHIGEKVRIKTLPELGDLGDTVYFGLKDAEGTVIINFSDTIVMDNIAKLDGDVIFYQEDFLSDVWTYFDEEDGVITNIYDKNSDNTGLRKKLFVGVFQISNSALFRACLEKASFIENLSMSAFYYALQIYSSYYPFRIVKTDEWFDIGHADKYFNSKLEVRAREFNHITIDRNRGILRKTSDDRDKFIGEIKWYLKLPADIEYVRPRIFDYSIDYNAPYVSMEYYSYHTLHELFLYGDLTLHQWHDIFERIRFVCNDFKRYTIKDDTIDGALRDMYLTKTIQRFEQLKKDARFLRLFEKCITVNGFTYKSLDTIIELLKKTVPELLYGVDSFSIIHGDLCFANILVDNNFSFIKVIDPRGKFGSFDIYGDFRYELAKLFHSIDGKYDFIIKDLFTIEYNLETAQITYNIQNRSCDVDLYELFVDTFKREIGDDLKRIELIEALLFLSMLPLHGESLDHQLAMLATGLEIFNRVVNIQEEESKNV